MMHNEHAFQGDTSKAEARTKLVLFLTGGMMVLEIGAGTLFKSMALLADGWHMGTHMSAFLIAVLAYHAARKHRDNPRFSFGTGKIGVLGGFASSLLLVMVALAIGYEATERLFNPVSVRFKEALIVAILGLLVNLISAILLKDDRGPGGHAHAAQGALAEDKNLKAAYLHVVADAFTSLTAILALILGLIFGVAWMDSLMGFAGSLVILLWAYGIVKDTVAVLIDYIPRSCDLIEEIRKAIEGEADTRIVDLHIWQVAAGKYAAIISICAKEPREIQEYYEAVNVHEELVHISIEVLKDEAGTGACRQV